MVKEKNLNRILINMGKETLVFESNRVWIDKIYEKLSNSLTKPKTPIFTVNGKENTILVLKHIKFIIKRKTEN